MKLDINSVIEAGFKHFKDRPSAVKVVANLPYYITTPIIMKFLEEEARVNMMVFMVQKEVADRITAKPGGKDYGALSVSVQYYSKSAKVIEVPPHCFIPQPDVDSTVIRMDILENPPVELKSRDLFFKVVKAAFGQRRKTLINALANSGYFMVSKEGMRLILNELGIDENRRGETLSIMQFAELSNSLFEKRQ
jgi:16S rRNA (adenine1518-N6/adenine1519-N6)-dimethyltransferase